MQQIIIDTLKEEIAGLRQQLTLIEERSEQIKVTLSTLETKLAEATEKQSVVPIIDNLVSAVAAISEEKNQSDIEVEIYVEENSDEHELADGEVKVEITATPQSEAVEEVAIVAEQIEEPAETDATTKHSDTTEDTTTETVDKHSSNDNIEIDITAKEEQVTVKPTSVANNAVTLPPIDDIRKGISLGDRFLFQRELFAGDGEKMNKTIDNINKLSSLDDAMAYIAKHFDWNSESQAYELFINLLKRRF